MDLIYSNAQGVEQGDFKNIGYTLDLAYGFEENDFELKVDSSDHILGDGWLIHINGTEYGGIVDSVKVSPDDDETIITYGGRTWHGILEGKTTKKNNVVYGTANQVLADFIEEYDLSGLFVASTEISEDYNSEIVAYTLPAYTGLYTAIRGMLAEHDMKLHIEWKGEKVELSVQQVDDYSVNEEWDSDRLKFESQLNYNLPNHFVVSYVPEVTEEDQTSYEIHLFTDEGGGVQPYTTTDVPIQDSDYILTQEKKLLTGIDEITESVPLTSASAVENYVLQTEQPSDWGTNFNSYYYYQLPDSEDGEGSFVAATAEEIQTYPKITSKPADWNTSYSNYFKLEYGEYKSVEPITTDHYVLAGTGKNNATAPLDWPINYGNYYYKFWDGTQYLYNSVEGVTKTWYKRQTAKPSDWASNFGSYYNYVLKYKNAKKKKGKYYVYESVSGTKKGKAPSWGSRRRFTQYQTTTQPAFKSSYLKNEPTTSVPTFDSTNCYTSTDVPVKPAWMKDTYYTKVLDHYSAMVEEGKKQIETVYTADNIEATLNADETENYDIGDIVGATDNITEMFVYQPISKKIVSIENEIISIEYKVGETK